MRLKSIDSEYSWPFASSFPRYAMQIVGGDRMANLETRTVRLRQQILELAIAGTSRTNQTLLDYLQIEGAHLVEGGADEPVTESPAANGEGHFDVVDTLRHRAR